MRLSEYAKANGVKYKTAWAWWKKGQIKGKQLPSGTIVVDVAQKTDNEAKACIYARVSSAENKDNLERQASRLTEYAYARGYKVYKVVKEVGSGLNDNRKKLAKVLTDNNYNILIVEHKDRLARFGTNYMKLLLEAQGKKLEIVNEAENRKDELMSDLIAIITSFCARLYGMRRSKRKTEKIIQELQSDATS